MSLFSFVLSLLSVAFGLVCFVLIIIIREETLREISSLKIQVEMLKNRAGLTNEKIDLLYTERHIKSSLKNEE